MRSFGRILASLLRTPAVLGMALALDARASARVAPAARLRAQEPRGREAGRLHHAAHHGLVRARDPWFNAHSRRRSASAATSRTATADRCGIRCTSAASRSISRRPSTWCFMLLAAMSRDVVLVGAARAQRAASRQTAGHPKGFAGGIEAMVLYIRNEVILPNVGPHGDSVRAVRPDAVLLHPTAEPARADSVRRDGHGQHLR